MVQRYFINLSFDGAGFSGWQRQPNAYSVQQCLEEYISTMLRQNVKITGAGRTDTEVHASHFYAHTDMEIRDFTIHDLVYKLNSFLPSTIVIHDIIPVISKANARFDAYQRTYEYYVALEKDPFYRHISYHYRGALDIDSMNKASQYLIGWHEFKGFSKKSPDINHYYCDVKEAYWRMDGHFLIFRITANRFLRNMVRAITGTLLDIGRKHLSPEVVYAVLQSQDRQKAGNSLPPHGLFLVDIDYPSHISYV